MQLTILTALVALLAVIVQETRAALKPGDCEVCIKFINKFEEKLTDKDRKDNNVVTKKLKKACKKAKGKENRFCYYVGGTEDAATYILNEITKPLAYFMKAEAICEKLKKKDKQICELQYDKELDWKTIDLKKMRVKQLKKILSDWDETCEGCLEKSDYVKRIESLKHQHVEL
eukprot:Seg3947.5 transcript_id=Seg3947.5/GoldUCD/mRNA.D3Y31 product="Mesencephalic astrocyte-derived neurotrophic factor" protein_id=Seg3947.5/GoldUCD/D3Y31